MLTSASSLADTGCPSPRAQDLSYLHKQFGALDINDEGYGEVGSQAPCAVALGDEGRKTPAPGPIRELSIGNTASNNLLKCL